MKRLALVLLAVVFASPGFAANQDLSDEEIVRMLETEQPRDQAMDRALLWIREQQRPDGALIEEKRHSAVMTAFGIMAHLAVGITFADDEHGDWMRRSLRYLLKMQAKDGYFGAKDESRMYGHGIVTLTLAESLGMIRDRALDEAVRSALEKAVAITVFAATKVKKSKGHHGGWRYHPHDRSSDLSLSGWQMMSLHACQQVGITVPEKVIQRAADYGKRLTDEDGKVGYQKRGQDHPALRGLGMLCFALAGNEDHDLVDAIAARIRKHPIEWKGKWFFYRAYYDAVGMSRARPDVWEDYKVHLEQILLDHQHEDGYWRTPPNDNEGSHGRIYITSMAVLALAVEHHALPVYQR